MPDGKSLEAGNVVLQRVSALKRSESILLLLSGGGSSLIAAPAGKITIFDKREAISHLMLAGADIFELNTVRKHLSLLKGGRLAAATAASVLTLVISDVPGDDVGTVASGLAMPDESSYADALDVLNKYGVTAPAVRRHIQAGVCGQIPETPGSDDPLWHKVETRLIGTNMMLLEAAQEYWRGKGYQAIILSDRIQGEARVVAREHAKIVEALRASMRASHTRPLQYATEGVLDHLHNVKQKDSRLVLLSGGETTVTVKGDGVGGRNQEFALWLLSYLKQGGIWALSAGSDGVDGNSLAAGAWLRPDSWQRAEAHGLSVPQFLLNNDSGSFFRVLGDDLVTGYSGNNLNDYRALVVDV